MSKSTHKVKRSSASSLYANNQTTKVRRATLEQRRQIILLLKSQDRDKIRYNKQTTPEEILKMFIKKYKVKRSIKLKIDQFIKKYNLRKDSVVEEVGLVYISGSIENLERAFNVELHEFEFKKEIKRYRQFILGHEGNISIPESIASFVTGIIGLSDVPLMHNFPDSNTHDQENFFSAAIGLSPSWFADHYNFPRDYSGKGQKIAIISCGGGITKRNVDHYFRALGLRKRPKIKYIPVGDNDNLPGSDFISDFELATDCLISMTCALGAEIEIYGTTNSIKGFSQAVLQIANGGKNTPKIISYSWGTNETNYSPSEIKCVNRILKYATLVKGITILCAVGDSGSTNNYSSDDETPLDVQFPASSPWVTACGGTKIKTNEAGDVVGEEVWNSQNNLYDILIQNATGGGFSKKNNRPEYQKKALRNKSKFYPKRGRGIPDISAHADMSPSGIGYWIRVNGRYWVSGGTSAVAPLMAALIARLNEASDRPIGFLNPILYEMAKVNAVTSINKGNNSMRNGPKLWRARKGWDPCTGLGIPNGTKMLEYLQKLNSKCN